MVAKVWFSKRFTQIVSLGSHKSPMKLDSVIFILQGEKIETKEEL